MSPATPRTAHLDDRVEASRAGRERIAFGSRREKVQLVIGQRALDLRPGHADGWSGGPRASRRRPDPTIARSSSAPQRGDRARRHRRLCRDQRSGSSRGSAKDVGHISGRQTSSMPSSWLARRAVLDGCEVGSRRQPRRTSNCRAATRIAQIVRGRAGSGSTELGSWRRPWTGPTHLAEHDPFLGGHRRCEWPRSARLASRRDRSGPTGPSEIGRDPRREWRTRSQRGGA